MMEFIVTVKYQIDTLIDLLIHTPEIFYNNRKLIVLHNDILFKLNEIQNQYFPKKDIVCKILKLLLQILSIINSHLKTPLPNLKQLLISKNFIYIQQMSELEKTDIFYN